jgi:hypothetical protein
MATGRAFRWERRATRPLTLSAFLLRRMLGHLAVSLAMVLVSLGFGMAGYEYFEGLAWPDAFENSAMLLGGMGPVNSPQTFGGKLFAGFYALYCGLLFLVIAAVIIAPVMHRVLHHFHWEVQQEERD